MSTRIFATFGYRFSILVAAVLASALAYAATEVQKARHEHYEKLGDSFKAIRDQSNAGKPDFPVLLAATQAVQEASLDQLRWFPEGSGPEAGKTRALPVIWSKPEEFAAAAKMFADRAPTLVVAAGTKDINAVKAAFRDVGGACKNCHDNFRAPE